MFESKILRTPFLSKIVALALLGQPILWAASPATPSGKATIKKASAHASKGRAAKHKGSKKARIASGYASVATPEMDAAPAVAPEGAHTSLILDARGRGMTRGMGPRIYSQSGQLVYGDFKSNWEYAQEHGVVSYANEMQSATQMAEAGENPLVVKVSQAHPQISSDGIVDDASAAAIQDASSRWDFLKYQRVIIVTEK